MDRSPPGRRAGAVEQLLADYRELAARYEALVERSRGERELARARELAGEEERARALGELASGVAHELNGVLHAMSLRLAALRRDRAGPSAALASLERLVGEAAKRVGRLEDLTRRRRDAPESDLDLGEVAREAAEASRPRGEGLALTGRAPVRVEVDVPALPRVVGEADEVRQVLSGLLWNAFDAMPAGGVVRIGGEARGDRAVLRVEDEGEGLSREALRRVFDPFFTTKGAKGTGLGLALARGVMERLGGAIRASNRPQGGALFELEFPLAQARRERPEPAPRQVARILVVDDDADVLEAVRLALEELGQEVETASSGPEALARLAGDPLVDLVLTDLGMPGMDGWQVAEAARRVRPGLRIYLVTAWANEIARDDPRRRCVSGVLPKPLPPEALERLLSASPGRERPPGRAVGAGAPAGAGAAQGGGGALAS